MTKHNEEVVREKQGLSHQCAEAIRQWDSVTQENRKLGEELTKVGNSSFGTGSYLIYCIFYLFY